MYQVYKMYKKNIKSVKKILINFMKNCQEYKSYKLIS